MKTNKGILFPLILTTFIAILVIATAIQSSRNVRSQLNTIPTLSPNPSQLVVQKYNSTIDTNSWVDHVGTGFFKFSIKAPIKSFVCIGETATGGNDNGCHPEGINLNNPNVFPYGIAFSQTTLPNPTLQI